jgi:plastocyanin
VRPAAVAVLVAVVLAGCANDGPTAGEQIINIGDGTVDAGPGVVEVVEAVIVGQDLSFDVTELEVGVGEELVVTFDNRDVGVPHDFHVRGPGVDVATEIVVGPVVQTLTVSFAEPGQYEYVCDVHPDMMRGTIIVNA